MGDFLSNPTSPLPVEQLDHRYNALAEALQDIRNALAAITAQYGSILNMGRVDGSNAAKASVVIDTQQPSGGGASSVPIGIIGRTTITGGTFSHADGVVGWQIPTVVPGDYRGVEGRVDAGVAGTIGTGVAGLVYLNTPNNTGTTITALTGTAAALQGAGTGTCIGLSISATGGGVNINAIFGDGTNNAAVLFQGYSTRKAGVMSAAVSASDPLNAFYIDLGDAGFDGMSVRFRDAAGAAALAGLTSGFGTAWKLDSSGRATLAGAVSPGTPAGVAQTGSVYQGSGAPSNSNGINGDVYFRTDTPGTANQRLYVKSAGAWVGIL